MKKLDTPTFIEKAKLIHKDKYDYSKVNYEHSLKKIEIICPKHGSWQSKPSNHINNKQGCPKCGHESAVSKVKNTKKDLIDLIKNKEKFNNYDFSLIESLKTMKDKVSIVCKIHGEYNTAARDIVRSKFFGCKKCRITDDTFTQEEYIQKSNLIHSNYYSYENLVYTNSHNDVTITCKKHGDFDIKAYIHIAGGGFCPKCTSYVSSYELEIADFLKSNSIDIDSSYRKFKDIKEVDIINHQNKIAIEFNGLYWHSDLFKSEKYHFDKTFKLNNLGYRLIHIFEDEWINKKDICKSIILNAFNKTKTKIFARKCYIKEVSSKCSQIFLNENHIQGNANGSIRYGLYLNNELISLMTFCRGRKNLGNKNSNQEFELLRFCNKINTTVIGGASKLLAHFKKNNKFKKIISYCDIRWGTGNLYKVLNFKLIKTTKPNYFYFKQLLRFNRFSFRKDVLIKKGYDKTKTESKIMKELKYGKIYDCGCYKFEYIYEDDLI